MVWLSFLEISACHYGPVVRHHITVYMCGSEENSSLCDQDTKEGQRPGYHSPSSYQPPPTLVYTSRHTASRGGFNARPFRDTRHPNSNSVHVKDELVVTSQYETECSLKLWYWRGISPHPATSQLVPSKQGPWAATSVCVLATSKPREN